METRRFILCAALAIVLYSLWFTWQGEHPVKPAHIGSPQSLQNISENSASSENGSIQATSQQLLPDVDETKNDLDATQQQNNSEQSGQDVNANPNTPISVKTDVLDLLIDPTQGNIIEAKLLNYPLSLDDKNAPFQLLSYTDSAKYTANSSLLERTPDGSQNIDFNFIPQDTHYQLSDNQQQLEIILSGVTNAGIHAEKVFHLTRGSYLIDVNYKVTNNSEHPWTSYLNTQLLQSSPEEDKSSLFHIGSYTGASYSNPGSQRYKKISFADMNKGNLNTTVTGGWIAMQQHYFLSAWIPQSDAKSTFYSRAIDNNYTIGSVSHSLVLQPGETKIIGSKLYLGPEVTQVLGEIAPGLDLTIDYGWLWFLSSTLFSVMSMIYRLIGNWGWAIVLVTVLVKLIFYRLSASSYRSMANMRQLQPKLLTLRERFGEDKAKLSQATMELYRQEKINPLGGCLPILVQIPVFIALYWVLLESVELRQAPFILWIKDLSVSDPCHVLPIIMGTTMLIQQKLNPAPPDPMQAKIMMFLPIMFTGLFWNFPAGLVLYWVVNNSLSILQQWYITQKYSDKKLKKSASVVVKSPSKK